MAELRERSDCEAKCGASLWMMVDDNGCGECRKGWAKILFVMRCLGCEDPKPPSFEDLSRG